MRDDWMWICGRRLCWEYWVKWAHHGWSILMSRACFQKSHAKIVHWLSYTWFFWSRRKRALSLCFCLFWSNRKRGILIVIAGEVRSGWQNSRALRQVSTSFCSLSYSSALNTEYWISESTSFSCFLGLGQSHSWTHLTTHLLVLSVITPYYPSLPTAHLADFMGTRYFSGKDHTSFVMCGATVCVFLACLWYVYSNKPEYIAVFSPIFCHALVSAHMPPSTTIPKNNTYDPLHPPRTNVHPCHNSWQARHWELYQSMAAMSCCSMRMTTCLRRRGMSCYALQPHIVIHHPKIFAQWPTYSGVNWRTQELSGGKQNAEMNGEIVLY